MFGSWQGVWKGRGGRTLNTRCTREGRRFIGCLPLAPFAPVSPSWSVSYTAKVRLLRVPSLSEQLVPTLRSFEDLRSWRPAPSLLTGTLVSACWLPNDVTDSMKLRLTTRRTFRISVGPYRRHGKQAVTKRRVHDTEFVLRPWRWRFVAKSMARSMS